MLILYNMRLAVPCHIRQHECDGWYIYSIIASSSTESFRMR